MRSLLILLISLTFFGIASAARAENRDALRFDRSNVAQMDIRCNLKNQVEPKRDDFVLVDYALMSSEDGNRVAIVTVKNDGGGQRIFTNKHIVALLANCETIYPYEFSQTVDSGDTVSTQISFGHQHYPIIKLLVSQQGE